MHADEAVLADKLGTLLETGNYCYDPALAHGPALLYLTQPVAWLSGARRYAQLTETTLRLAPVFCGLLLVALPLALARALTHRVALGAALLTAVSPAMVYYSRYYIPEMLLVCLSLGAIVCGWRWVESRRRIWALAAGACLGLMYATKETALIAFAAVVLAAVLARWRAGLSHLVAAAAAAVLLALLMNPQGLMQAPGALRAYAARATSDPFHVHPWYYYFPPLRGEAAIAALAVCGLLVAWRRADAPLQRLLARYALILTAAYAAIPYKTPWCLLGFWHAWILLAALGLGWLWDRVPRAALALGFLVVVGHLGWQAWLYAHPEAADPRNPYVYAHTTTDVFTIRDRLAQLDPATAIQVISRANLWPLPWYLRAFPNVEWWNAVPENAPSAPLIFVTPDMEPALPRRLYELPPPGERPLYVPFLEPGTQLRPGLELRAYALPSLQK